MCFLPTHEASEEPVTPSAGAASARHSLRPLSSRWTPIDAPPGRKNESRECKGVSTRQRRRCLKIELRKFDVVPARDSTHNHRTRSLPRASTTCALRMDSAVWVPALAGTTACGLAHPPRWRLARIVATLGLARLCRASGANISPGPYRSFRELSLAGSVDPDIWCPPTFVGNSGIECFNGVRGFALRFFWSMILSENRYPAIHVRASLFRIMIFVCAVAFFAGMTAGTSRCARALRRPISAPPR